MELLKAVDAWVDFERYVRRVNANSAALYAWHLRRFAAFAGRGLSLESAAARVEPYLVALGRRGVSDNTFAKAFTVLRAFYRWGQERGHCASAPLRWTKTPRVRAQRRTWATPEQVEQMLKAAATRGGQHAERDGALLATLYLAGLRNAEARGARVEDVDLAGRTLRVYGKGGKVELVPLSPRLAAILAAWMRVRPADSPYLFPSRARHAIRPGKLDNTRVARIVRQVRALAGLPNVTPHTLRRSAATHLRQNARAPLEAARAFLRHSDVRTTMLYLEDREAERLRRWVGKL